MITKEIEVNGSKFNLTLTDQVISQVDNLKSLYATAAEDPEMFEQVSSEISTTINQIAASVTPEASDSYLDGLIQEIFKAVEDKKSEVDKQLKDKEKIVKYLAHKFFNSSLLLHLIVKFRRKICRKEKVPIIFHLGKAPFNTICERYLKGSSKWGLVVRNILLP